jgi:hypothetical protein
MDPGSSRAVRIREACGMSALTEVLAGRLTLLLTSSCPEIP